VLPRQIVARLERIDIWSLPWLYIGIIGAGFIFTFYDIFDINVSFIQTCTQISAGCTPAKALNSLTLPLLLNLVGYVVGTLTLSPLSDRIGRRNMLLITMVITGLGSLYTAFSPGLGNFDAARLITGIGIGADLAVVNTYINEVAPRRQRAKYTSLIVIASAIGAFVAVWLGLILTTPSAPWPLGLPGAVGATFTFGWRAMYLVGTLLALVGILLRVQLPESPRWLLGQGRFGEADRVVSDMEERASRHGKLAEPDESAVTDPGGPASPVPYTELLTSRVYLPRILLLFSMWFIGYITVYSYGAGFTAVLASLKIPPPEAGVIVAVGAVGFIVGMVFAYFFVEKLERQYWVPIAAVLTIIGGVLVAEGGTDITLAMAGAAIIFVGFNLWVPPMYARSAESFPTRARTTGFGIVDGVGHVGGGIGVAVVAPFLPNLGTLGALLLLGGFLCVAAIIAQFGPSTRGRPLDEISP
jgi:MFS family permease